jgi:hypothetical protein
MKKSIGLILITWFFITGCQTAANKPSETTAAGSEVAAEAQKFTGTGTLVIKPITFRKDAYVRQAVKQQCNLDGKLAQFIEQYAADQYANIITDTGRVPKNAQVLTVVIDEVVGGGGGAWSGAKAVKVKGTLTKNGKVIGDFIARRYSGGGFFGAYKGTCAIMGRCVKALGRDIAEWLQNPTQRAALGDL